MCYLNCEHTTARGIPLLRHLLLSRQPFCCTSKTSRGEELSARWTFYILQWLLTQPRYKYFRILHTSHWRRNVSRCFVPGYHSAEFSAPLVLLPEGGKKWHFILFRYAHHCRNKFSPQGSRVSTCGWREQASSPHLSSPPSGNRALWELTAFWL